MTPTLRSLVVNSKAKHTATVIFLHGLGDTGSGWEGIGHMLSPALPFTKFIFPNAPVKPVTLNFGAQMPAWYDIISLDRENAKEDEPGMLHTVEQINGLIKAEIDAGIPSDRIILGGFSQGGAMTLLTGLTTTHKLAGLVCLSGYLPLAAKMDTLQKTTNKATPIFMGHGTADQVVNYQWARLSEERLKSLGYNVDFKSYAGMEHSANDTEFKDLLEFLSAQLK
ncbi:acyl-protein thioesterase-like protein 1,2 [Globomyces pollinis-pini]|nr:acyl-protein thioesterase-like protein 1,2 [Globomyces pollinis-pini]